MTIVAMAMSLSAQLRKVQQTARERRLLRHRGKTRASDEGAGLPLRPDGSTATLREALPS